MGSTLVILNDAPYGTERSYNGLRVAGAVAKKGEKVQVFLIGDAAACAKSGQQVPKGYYNLERMIKNVIRRDAEVGVCGSCIDARGITEEELIEGTHRSSMGELADWTVEADRVITF